MKRAILFGLTLALFSSCHKIRLNRLVGTWKTVEWTWTEGTYTYDYISNGESFNITFEEDGNGNVLIMEGHDITANTEITWTEDEKVKELRIMGAPPLFAQSRTYEVEKITGKTLHITGKTDVEDNNGNPVALTINYVLEAVD